MKPGEIKKAIVRMKTELELAAFTGKPHAVVKRLYSRLKELQYQLIMAEISQKKEQPGLQTSVERN